MIGIRAGVPVDLEPAVAVWHAASTARRDGRPLPPEHETRIRRYLRKPGAFLLVAADGGAVVGMALGMPGLAEDGAGPPVPGLCHVAMVFVAPARWGEGIGRRLVEALAAEARRRGFDRAQLWTQADSARAARLYEGCGFRKTGRTKNDDFGETIEHYERPL